MKSRRHRWTCSTRPLYLSLLLLPAFLFAQDDGEGEEKTWLFGGARLVRPDPAIDEDASGFVHLLEHGDRKALHVHVRHLDPGAVYEVTAALGDKTETIGSITTRKEEDEPPPRLYVSRLSGEKEVPPVETDAHGFGVFILNRERTQLHYHIFTKGLSGPAMAAHIHQGAAGEEGPPIVTLDHATLEGTVDVTAEIVAQLASGNTYANVHTEANPDGEIRGQVKPIRHRHWGFFHRRAGIGSLRLDTNREDKLPFEAQSIADLKGIVISVLDAEKRVVLSATVEEIRSIGDRHDDGKRGGGGAFGEEDGEDPPAGDAGLFFGMDELHDASFTRGDANDDGRFDLSDPVVVLGYLFLGGAPPYCMDSADADDNGTIDVSDPIAMLRRQFLGDGPLAHPFTRRGFDRSADTLFCEGD